MAIVFRRDTKEFSIDVDYDINFVRYKGDEGEHTHKFVELVYILGGIGVHTVNGKEFHVRRGDMLVINYRCRHEVRAIENHYYVDIMLKPEYLSKTLEGTDDLFLILQLSEYSDISNVARDNVLIHFNAEERERIEFLLNLTREEKDGARPAKNTMIYSALSIILGTVFRKMAEEESQRLSVNDRLLSYIDKNCHIKLSVGELAKMCGYTPEHFSRIFKSYTGKSPVEYILGARIERTKELLRKTDKTIEVIVGECGFSNRTAFFKKFTAAVGLTPLQYRKNQK